MGKSGGARAIVAFRIAGNVFFVYGFPKNAGGNIGRDELKGFQKLADVLLGLDDAGLKAAAGNGTLIEVNCDADEDGEGPPSS